MKFIKNSFCTWKSVLIYLQKITSGTYKESQNIFSDCLKSIGTSFSNISNQNKKKRKEKKKI